MTRADHMAWAKKRALDLAEEGHGALAMASMISDLGKHPEIERSVTIAGVLLMTVDPRNKDAVKKWVEGFN